MKNPLSLAAHLVRRACYLVRAAAGAVVLGLIELVSSERGRRTLALATLGLLLASAILARPVELVSPGEVVVRISSLTGRAEHLAPGLAVALPLLHVLRRYPAGDVVYRPERSARSAGAAPYQSVEGLSIGVEVTVRYAFDLANERLIAQGLPEQLGPRLVEPVADAVLHRTLARHTVREIFSSKRSVIEREIEEELRPLLAGDGVVLRAVFLGTIDLPPEYKKGLEQMLTEELSSEKMRFTLELEEKRVKEAELTATAEKVRREKAAEAAAEEELIAARGRSEAMKHILPFKEKEIQQKRLEAEASRVTRLELARAEAEARRIEAEGEADYRRKLAESEAYRLEITGKAESERLARDAEVISRNPLMIQKTLADKLSDKVQVIIAPPSAGGFLASGLLGRTGAPGEVAREAPPASDE